VTLAGWVASQRDLGGMIFIDLRDRRGTTQWSFTRTGRAIHRNSQGAEDGIGHRHPGRGVAAAERHGQFRMATGAVEILADDLIVFNEAKPLPF